MKLLVTMKHFWNKQNELSNVESMRMAWVSMMNEDQYPKSFSNIGFVILPTFKDEEESITFNFLDEEK